jgi:membrane protein
MTSRRLKKAGAIIKASFSGFNDDNIPKLSASLAYYTIFSMGPLLFMVVLISSIFYGRAAIEGKIYDQLVTFTGHDTALQLQYIIKNAALMGKGMVAIIIGGIALLIGATSVFAEIQGSLNMIWQVKPKPKKGWLKYLQNRFLSFSIIIGFGFLLLVSLAISTVLDSFAERIQSHFPGMSIILLYVINTGFTLLIITLIFGTIFKVLPDVKIKWRDVIIGSIVTASLFMLGKFCISFYIGKSRIGSYYGTAGALIIFLLWIYYSSVILYYGAEFIKAYALKSGTKIIPAKYAVGIQTLELEQNS